MNQSFCRGSRASLISALRRRPDAEARLTGSSSCPGLSGIVRFYQTEAGVIVYAEVSGLPHSKQPCRGGVFGFHIHQGTGCGGGMADPFADAMSHYDPANCAHPRHAGDLPPLFENGGYALSVFLTDRFSVEEVTGRAVIIHQRPDDFTTQPSGNSGAKIACGTIRKPETACR